MAGELQYFGNPDVESGRTVVALLYSTSAAPALVGTVACAENAERTAIYVGDMPQLEAGNYVVRFTVNQVFSGQGMIGWTGTAERTTDSTVSEIHSVTAMSVGDTRVETPSERTVGTKTYTKTGDGVTSLTLTRTA